MYPCRAELCNCWSLKRLAAPILYFREFEEALMFRCPNEIAFLLLLILGAMLGQGAYQSPLYAEEAVSLRLVLDDDKTTKDTEYTEDRAATEPLTPYPFQAEKCEAMPRDASAEKLPVQEGVPRGASPRTVSVQFAGGYSSPEANYGNSRGIAPTPTARRLAPAPTAPRYDNGAGVVHTSALLAPSGADWALRARVVELEKKLADLKADSKEEEKEEEPELITFRWGGRLGVEWATFSQDATNIAVYGNSKDGCQIRRARLRAEGEMFHVGEYQVELEFANAVDESISPLGDMQSTEFKTTYFGVNELPLLNRVRVGFVKEPLGLEWETSSRYIPFMERSLATSALVPRRNLGIETQNWSSDERTTWAFGLFRSQTPDQPPIRMLDHSGTAFTARVTRLPWYNEESGGRGLFHVGLGYTVRSCDNHTLDIDSQDETRFGPNIVNTGEIDSVRHWQVVGPEAAFVYGPLAIQSEFYHMDINRGDQDNLSFNGYYAEVTYFLTGEHRRFDRTAAKFKEVVPFENFFCVRTECGNVQTGKGAWEIGYRHSYLDLDSGPISGGRASSHTFGLNWYLNPNMRCMFNYVIARSTPGDGNPMSDSGLFQVRAQLWF